MSCVFGENIRLTIFGESHASAIGMTLEGLPAGVKLDRAELQRFLDRRAPGRNGLSTARREADEPEFLCGLVNDVTCGTPITAIIRNGDARRSDYDALRDTPRPGHADYTAWARYGEARDVSGGGNASGRLTAALCVAGGVCLQFLARQDIRVAARIVSIGGISDPSEYDGEAIGGDFPVVDPAIGEKMRQRIGEAQAEGDSVGGVIGCVARGIPAGIGSPLFGGMENRISQVVFAIPAVKGIEFGSGFAGSQLTGSGNNDAFRMVDGEIRTATNRAGGILGGITTGMPLVFRVAVKPTPSIARAQQTVKLSDRTETTISIRGRHDPCIVPRAVPCVEAAAAIAVTDAILEAKKNGQG